MTRASALVIILVLIAGEGIVNASEWIWAKGNIHTHTSSSDGDSSPQVTADWYRDHGYQFLVITDHGTATDVSSVQTNSGFLLIPGEEISMPDQGDKPIHGVAINATRTLSAPASGRTQAETLVRLVDFIIGNECVPVVCHPNWCWAFTHREVLDIRKPYILEIANMGSDCNNEGSISRLSLEQVWDFLLSHGREVYAAATDDTHFISVGSSVPDGPGRGWVVARVTELTRDAIVSALASGNFYSSTGVELLECSFDGGEIRVSVAPTPGRTYLIRFIGKWGSILQETVGTSASYEMTDKSLADSYVRCKVICSDGTVAWTQAYRQPKAGKTPLESR